MKFYVNLKDSEEGIRLLCDDCPSALALRRKLKLRRQQISVTPEVVLVYSRNRKLTRKFVPSNKLTSAIEKYDQGGYFEPGHYSVREVDKNLDVFA
jgi:hypothetical protein